MPQDNRQAVGLMYVQGQGVPQDNRQAMEWFLKSAAQGYSMAQYRVGVGYMLGKGVAQDKCQAVRWFRKAATQGNKEAQEALREMHPRLKVGDSCGVQEQDKTTPE